MKKIFLLLLLAMFIFKLNAQEPKTPKNYTNIHISQYMDSLIRAFTPEINADSIRTTIQALQDYGTRYAYVPNRKEVALWIKNKYLSFGITNVELDSFTVEDNGIIYMQYNVIATIPGTINPNKVYIIGGHYDSYSTSNPMFTAPGADDNASGTVAAIEIARVMKKKNYQPETTIKFIAFAAEETFGTLRGSEDFALKARNANMDIGLMINNDMISNVNDTITGWILDIHKYNGAEWASNLAYYLTYNYTSVIPYMDTNVNAWVDSYPFFVRKYDAIYFDEHQFSHYYHSPNDIVANCKMNYCAEIVRSSAGLILSANESPVIVKYSSLIDMGNGNSLQAKWYRNNDVDLVGYKIYIGDSSNNYTTFFSTTDTTFIISGLNPGTRYYVGVSAIDTKGNESVSVEKSSIPQLIPRTPTGFECGPMCRKIKTSWNKNFENDLLGYNVYRSTTSGQNFIKVNTLPVIDSIFIDSLVNINTYYFYKITAIDSLLYESFPTTELTVKTALFNKGILVVDDSEGGLLNPTDSMVDNYYDQLLSNYYYTNYDANRLNTISIDTMTQYSSILWHIENTPSSYTVFYRKINEIKKYLYGGGKMILTFDRPSRVVMHNSIFPLNLTAGNFMYDYMKIKKVEYLYSSRFFGAKPLAPGYDSVYIDLQKTPSNFNHHITNIEAIFADSIVANNIYIYDSQYDTSSIEGAMKNKPVGVEYIGNQYKIITLSFPLYYMNLIQSKRLIDYILSDKFHEPTIIKEDKYTNNINFTISPNPAKLQTTIYYNLKEDNKINISVYNMTGVLIKTLTNKFEIKGEHQLQFDASSLQNGIYLIKMINGKLSVTEKLVLLK